MNRLLLSAIISIFPVTSMLTGCASMNAAGTEPVLSAAGFRVVTPKTEEQRKLYAELPAYKLQRGNYNDKVFYAYKNEEQGVAYVGDEKAYQQYQNLALQKSIARDNREAAMMNDMMATNWYGAYYGPGYIRY